MGCVTGMPFLSPGYLVTLAITIGAYAIAAMGLNITMGRAGQVNLGQAAFVGVGAMTSAILTTQYGLSFWAGLLAAAVSSMAIGVLLGLVSIRLRHDFLAITTIGFNFIVVFIFLYYDVFGGSFGITGIPSPSILGYTFDDKAYAVMVWVIVAILALLAWRMEKTWMGLAFEAIAEDEDVAESIGIDVKKYKVLAFSIGAMYGGIAGVLLAHYKGYIVYSDFEFTYSIMILTMSIVGGLDTVSGAIAGSAIVILLPEVFRPLMEYRMIMYALLILVMLLVMPTGLLGRRSILMTRLREQLGLGRLPVAPSIPQALAGGGKKRGGAG